LPRRQNKTKQTKKKSKIKNQTKSLKTCLLQNAKDQITRTQGLLFKKENQKA